MFCSEWCLVKLSDPGLTIIPLRCKCWTCYLCAPLRTAQLVSEAAAGRPNRLITLTSRNVPGTCPHAAARALVRAFRTIRAEYLEEHGKGSWEFLCVFEKTKRGWPHLHLVCRSKWISQKWLKKRMRQLTNSPSVDVRKIYPGDGRAAYVAKYIGKDPSRFEGTKRYWRSKGYLFPATDTDEEDRCTHNPWQVVKQFWLDYILEAEANGILVDTGGYDLAWGWGRPP